jgi:hypothetical protein
VRKQTTIFLTILISLSACSNPKVDKKTISLIENKTVTDTLPIHGELSKQQLQKYYPKITDTIKDLSIIFSEPLNTQQATDIYTSMLHNSGTFDQMFLCTHDKNFNLLDCYYVGKSTMFDGNSHSIEYQKINDNSFEFHHVDWGYVKNEIDTIKYQKYSLTVTQTGRIEKK